MIYDDDAVVEQQGAEQSNASGIDANKLDLSGNLVWGNPWPERFVWSPLSPDNKFVGRRWLSEMSSTGPKLTLEGRSIKTVMFASMLGGTCKYLRHTRDPAVTICRLSHRWQGK